MTLVYGILFFGSGFFLFLIFLRRMRLTLKDIRFQKHLAEEQAMDAEVQTDTFATPEDAALPKTSARSSFTKGEAHWKKGEWMEAELAFLAALQADPLHLDAHHKLGLLYLQVENFPQAELYFSRLINLKKDPVYYSNLGAALYQQQRLVEAAEAYENAIAMDDKRAERMQSLAHVYYELGDDQKALYYLEQALVRKPKDTALQELVLEQRERVESTKPTEEE
jgi:tetratricopeptide (TPR) repeat protein